MKNSKVKRILAITMVAAMLCGTVVSAAEPSDSEVSAQEGEVLGEENANAGEQGGSEAVSAEGDADLSEEGVMDEQTAALEQEYLRWLNRRQARAMVGTYESELAKFPADYQALLKELHAKHPKWIFVAVNSGLDWNEVVKQESVSGSSSGTNRSLLPKTSASLLLSKAGTDYNTSTGEYIAKDGSTWVSASKPAVAYYADPRNFLTDNYIYLFEALDFNEAYHTEQSVENVLKNTDLAGKMIEYIDTTGKTVPGELTYGQTILAAGAKEKVSPVFLASKIKQETGGKLTNGSISGNFSYGGVSYRGYYNFYNIGATPTSTGSAVENGLKYAKGEIGGTSYQRPWTSPMLAINGGAQFIGSSYISKGQNTLYFERFNTIASPYYQHQYMQNLTGAASEAKTTYNSYQSMGIVDNGYVFYIPVYKNMPDQSGTVNIAKTVKTGKITSSVTLRKGPSTAYESVTTIPKDANVTVDGGVYTDKDVAVSTQQSNPYWVKVTYGSNAGYISANYLQMNADSKINVGAAKQLSVTGNGGKTYYETSNPAIATVDENGKVTGIKAGTCTIYAVNGSGKQLDAIGIEVAASSGSSGGGSTTPPTPPPPPTPPAPTVKYDKYTTTTKVNYRSGAGTSYAVKGTLASGKEIDVEQGYSKDANGYTWYRFKLNGTNYYIASKYLKKGLAGESTNPNPPTLKYDKYTTTANVNYRDGAGTLYAKKGTLSKGMQIDVEQGYSKSANGYTWYRFKLNGTSYYIASEYLKKGSSGGLVITPTPPTPAVKYEKYTTTTRVNYRIGAGTSYWTRGTFEKGKQLDIEQGYSVSANGYTWYRFNLNGTNYYIASNYVKKVSSGGSTVTPPAQNGKYVTTTRVNYRIGAGTSYWVRGTFEQGKQIEIEQGYSTNANGYTWYRFKLSGTNYYIASKYLKKV